MLVRLVRKGVSRFIALTSWFTRPAKIERSEQERRELAQQARCIALYDYKGCPSSIKTQREIYRLNIEIECRDIGKSQVHRDNLLSGLGCLKAPCLRVEERGKVQWIDEPEQIVHYLHERFGPADERLSA